MNVGNQIKNHRRRMKLTQVELAEKLYISSQTISNWENERSYPDIHNLIALTILFNISLDELVKGDITNMKEIIKKSNYSRYNWIMLIMFLLALISFEFFIKEFGLMGLIIPVILVGIGLFFSRLINDIEKSDEVKKYKDIVVFLDENNNKFEKDNIEVSLAIITILLSLLLVFQIIFNIIG